MADNERPHFVVPTTRIIHEKIIKTGRSVVYDRPNFSEHGKKILERTFQARKELSESQDFKLSDTYYLEFSTPKDVPIKREKKLLKQIGIEIVAYSKRADNIGIGKISSQDYIQFQQKISNYSESPNNQGREILSYIENISSIPYEEKISTEILQISENVSVKCIISLYADLSSFAKEEITESIFEFMQNNNGDFIDYYNYSTGETSILVNAPIETLKQLGQHYFTLRQIMPDHLFIVTDSTPISILPSNIIIESPLTDITVAIIDSGIQPACPLLSPIIKGNTSSIPGNAVGPHYEHGSFVASRVAYGDDLEAQLQNSSITPNCYLYDISVMGKDNKGNIIGIDEHDLGIAIDQAVNNFTPDIRVVNISLGTGNPIINDYYSNIASIIDQLARKKDILFITTSGNIRDQRLVSLYPANVLDPIWRIDLPGESILALTVGSIARYIYTDSLSQIGELSPFSRIGPGADGGVKPELVAHGGNCRKNGLPISIIATQGLSGSGKHIAWDFGTSFAAPIVAGIAAQLFGYLGAPTANLVKALLCHFTDPAIVPRHIQDSTRCVGFGIPNLNNSKFAGKYSAAFLTQSTITAENYIFVPFHVPKAMGTYNRVSKLCIKGTLVFDPPVQISNSKEYSCCRISIAIIKPSNGVNKIIGITGDDILSRVAWNPIIKFDKDFRRSYDTGEWFIRLRLWTRGPDENIIQKFALVLEVIDESNNVDIWSEIHSETGNQFTNQIQQVA